MTGMYTDLLFVTGLIELAVALDVVVIADTFPMETGIVAGSKHIDREALVAAGCRTMNYNKGYFPGHSFTFLEPVGGAALYCDGSQNAGNHGRDEFQHLSNGGPIDFYHISFIFLIKQSQLFHHT